MISRLSYSPEENLRRIMMDKATKYILVEGETDVPKYEAYFQQLFLANTIEYEYHIVQGGSKGEIIEYIKQNLSNNFVAIVDHDFDGSIYKNNKLIVLKRYSVENYIFDLDVIVPLIIHMVNETETQVKNWFTLSDWLEHTYRKCNGLVMALSYYQLHMSGDRKRWKKAVLIKGGSSWEISEDKITDLLNDLWCGNSLPWNDIADSFTFIPLNRNRFHKVFPGKLLAMSFYRYVKDRVNKSKKAKFGSYFSNENAFMKMACANLNRSSGFRRSMEPVVRFITA